MEATAILHYAALRRLLVARHPDLLQDQGTTWNAWVDMRRTKLPDPKLPQVYVAVSINSLDDISLHTGLLQVLSDPEITAFVVLLLPNQRTVTLAHAEAMLEGWAPYVAMMTAAEWVDAAARLPSSARVIQFRFPATFSPFQPEWGSPTACDELMAAAEPPGAVTVGFEPDVGESDGVGLPPALAAHLAALLKVPAGSLIPSANHADSASQGPTPVLAEALYRPRSIVLTEVFSHDLVAVTTVEADGQSHVLALQSASLGDSQGSLTTPLSPRFSKTVEQRLHIHVLPARGEMRSCQATMRVGPSTIEPWMLSAYLNRGGGGNPIVTAFARGVGCRLAYVDDELACSDDQVRAIPVVWGVLRGSDQIVAQAKAQTLPFYYIDHAYFDRGHGNSYRIAYCGYEAGAVRDAPDDRLGKLGVDLQPWRKSGRTIVVCPPSEFFAAAHGCSDWLEETLARLRLETDRPIVIRHKPQAGQALVPLAKALEDAHALVTHSSNVAIEAACLGTPVFVAPTSAAAPIGSTDLTRIEAPRYPDRLRWLAHLAYSQFTLEEFASGEAWRIMREYEGKAYV